MIFSNRKQLSKLLSLVLTLTLMATLFTGCFGKGKEEETEPNININLDDTTGPTETETQPATTEPTEINENMGTVLSQLTVRSSPSTDATVVGTLYAGDKIEVQRRETVVGIDWAYIIAPETGWICMDFVEMDFTPEVPPVEDTSTPAGATTPTETQAEEKGESVNIKGVIAANGLNIRAEASTSSDIKGSYNKGDVVTILETKNGWGRTNKGWIKMEYVNTNATTTNNTDKDKDTNKDNDKTTVNIVSNGSTTVQFRGIVTAKDLNIRADASQSADRVGNYTYGARVEIFEKNGNWGRTDKGWISLSYIYQDGTSGTNTANGYVTTDGLNVRNGPGKEFDVVGSYNDGDYVNILEQFTYGDTTWGCTKKGWISMAYVDTDDSDKDDDNTDTDQDSTDNKTGYVNADGLRIRSGPGTDYAPVGSLEFGEKVTILDEVEDGDGVLWGKISSGWISLEYVELE